MGRIVAFDLFPFVLEVERIKVGFAVAVLRPLCILRLLPLTLRVVLTFISLLFLLTARLPLYAVLRIQPPLFGTGVTDLFTMNLSRGSIDGGPVLLSLDTVLPLTSAGLSEEKDFVVELVVLIGNKVVG